MKVRRIVPNVAAAEPAAADRFYGQGLGLDLLMDHGWIRTYGRAGQDGSQISIASEGGSGTPVPDVSIEVDDLDEALHRLAELDWPAEYGPVLEPWGVRRAFVRDPFGRLVNILAHP